MTIIDDPLIDYGPSSGAYDGEGVPHSPVTILDQGVLANFLYDLDTAGRTGTKSTGHGEGCGPSNLVIPPGDVSFEGMVQGVKQGLLVHTVMGLGQGNPMSGAFSVNVGLGYKIEDGHIAGRVKDVMLSGNTYDAIRRVEAVGAEPEWTGSPYGGSCLVPAMQFGGLSVVAG